MSGSSSSAARHGPESSDSSTSLHAPLFEKDEVDTSLRQHTDHRQVSLTDQRVNDDAALERTHVPLGVMTPSQSGLATIASLDAILEDTSEDWLNEIPETAANVRPPVSPASHDSVAPLELAETGPSNAGWDGVQLDGPDALARYAKQTTKPTDDIVNDFATREQDLDVGGHHDSLALDLPKNLTTAASGDPRSVMTSQGLATCRHGLHYDPRESQGCVLCQRERGADRGQSKSAPWALVVLLVIVAVAAAAFILSKRQIAQSGVRNVELPSYLNRAQQSDGRVKVVHLWATWCPTCVTELPEIEKVASVTGLDEIDLMMLSIDESQLDVAKFVSKTHLSVPTEVLIPAAEDEAIVQWSSARSHYRGVVPYTAIFDGRGQLHAEWIGARDLEYYASRIDEAQYLEPGHRKAAR